MLKVLKPITLTDAMLLSSSMAETEHPAWSALSAYTVGTRAIHAHAVWQCKLGIAASAGNPTPDVDTDHWVYVGPTNRWAMFDNNVNTRSVGGSTGLAVAIKPGRCNGVALLDLVGVSAATLVCSYPIPPVPGKATDTTVSQYAYGIELTRVTDYVSGTVTQTYAITLATRNVMNWHDYFTKPFVSKTDVFVGFSSRSDWTITLNISNAGAQVGWMLSGNYIEIGDVGYGVSSEITDYSDDQTNQFGVTRLIERDYVKRVTYPLTVDNTLLRAAYSALADLRAKPALFIASDDYRYTPFTVFGRVSRASAGLSFATYSVINVEVKGLIL